MDGRQFRFIFAKARSRAAWAWLTLSGFAALFHEWGWWAPLIRWTVAIGRRILAREREGEEANRVRSWQIKAWFADSKGKSSVVGDSCEDSFAQDPEGGILPGGKIVTGFPRQCFVYALWWLIFTIAVEIRLRWLLSCILSTFLRFLTVPITCTGGSDTPGGCPPIRIASVLVWQLW